MPVHREVRDLHRHQSVGIAGTPDHELRWIFCRRGETTAENGQKDQGQHARGAVYHFQTGAKKEFENAVVQKVPGVRVGKCVGDVADRLAPDVDEPGTICIANMSGSGRMKLVTLHLDTTKICIA